jgi:sirohydrochlorin ferrochelatase
MAASWLLLVLVSFAAGLLLVWYLTCPPLRMGLAMLLFCATLFSAVVILGPGMRAQYPESLLLRWLAVVVAVAGFFGGYATLTRIVLNRPDPRPVPALTRAPDDPGDGHTAVIYFTHGEPELYDPIGWINQFNEFDEQGISFVPFVARPWFIKSLRDHYLIVGRSDHRRIHHHMIAALEDAYRQQGDTDTRFYISFLDDNPRPDAALIQALNEGASHIVVAEVFLTISNHTAEGEHRIQAVELPAGVTMAYTGPLWDSALLRSMFVARANTNLGQVAKGKTAVLLVGHGQPDEWDREWPTETEQEIGFRQEVLKLLAADGFDPAYLGIAWMEFKQPKPAKLVEQFVQAGAEQVLFFSAAISADSLHSQFDVPELVERARVPEHIRITNLGAWNDDPLVIAAIKERVDGEIGVQPKARPAI